MPGPKAHPPGMPRAGRPTGAAGAVAGEAGSACYRECEQRKEHS
jgi:hypothetical protein